VALNKESFRKGAHDKQGLASARPARRMADTQRRFSMVSDPYSIVPHTALSASILLVLVRSINDPIKSIPRKQILVLRNHSLAQFEQDSQ
jgi:hypothetical protein